MAIRIITIIYDDAQEALADEGDLFGYLANELENDGIETVMTERAQGEPA